jgi:hypothetical protein
MDDDHDQDPDPPSPPATATEGRCPCCSPSSSLVVPWRRSVKRKLGAEKEEEEAGVLLSRFMCFLTSLR